jgi:cytochrome c553
MPASNALVRIVLPAVLGALVGAGAVEYRHRADVGAATASTQAGTAANAGATGDLRGAGAPGISEDALRSEVARLKANAPSQSHTMSDVGYHWTNLWFAGEKKNWPLATFYFEETRQHILWTIRLRPVRKGADGKDVDLVPIFEGIDTSAFKAMAEAIQQQDAQRFAAAYRMTLEACYGCHKASGKPYLRPMIPTAPSQTIINVDPAATWPQ